MRIGRKTRVGLVATIGTAAVLALGASPASAVQGYVQYPIGSGSCAGYEEIQPTWVDGGWHDIMENNPTQASATDPYRCLFTLIDNGGEVWRSSGAGSGWWPDGPTHHMQACAERWYNTVLLSRDCGPIN
ncbi:hypothetical protein [Streptomyces sp. NRRL WC-3742]|uniref:hypothetical protein n=1 Tax=Streptomyces sp. NRRL WC-3742 TaxID=1463934 RepID=UPI0004CAB110|nr:hypothetical protein [Streptomyces sp. NRRL WC-3742]